MIRHLLRLSAGRILRRPEFLPPLLLLFILLSPLTARADDAPVLRLADLALFTPAPPSEAETLAVSAFARRVEAMTGVRLPSSAITPLPGKRLLSLGIEATLPEVFALHGWKCEDPARGAQSYVLAAEAGGIVAAGFGTSDGEVTSKSFIGLGYALGDLLRRVDFRDGEWRIFLPAAPVIQSPAMPNRTLYLMNSNHMNDGVSLEYFSDQEVEDYADFLIEARYSRVSLWQWTSNMLYPGNFEENRARNQRVHRKMRHLFDYARRRGLEVWHQLAPMHANVDLLPDDPKFVATGYYGRNSICWAQPEGRELARRMAQEEMQYYGPVDGYIVWFYDPGGCFCDVCYPNQAKHLFEQFSMVNELAAGISPGAEFQAVLWPTWCFQDYQDRGIPYKSVDEVQTFVRSFLKQMLDTYGARNIAIMDTTELEISNLYNGLVKPEEFKRTAFMYSIMGLPSESAYPFTAFRLGDLVEAMGKARDRGLEDAVFFIQYAATNRPAVFTFADALYEQQTTAEESAQRFAQGWAKGPATDQFTQILLGLDTVYQAKSYAEKAETLEKIEDLAAKLGQSPVFFAGKDWLRGQLLAQRHYLALARAQDEPAFAREFEALKAEVGAIPMYSAYIKDHLTPRLAADHVKTYWRGPLNDRSIVGLPAAK